MIPLTLAKRQALRQATLQRSSTTAEVGLHAQLMRRTLAAPTRGLSTTSRRVTALSNARLQPAAVAPARQSITHRAFSSAPTRRTNLTPPTAPFTFLTGYSFAGKPRGSASPTFDSQETDRQRTSGSSTSSQVELPQQGFPSESEIGRWRNELLRGKDAGEDSLMCAGMKGEGDCVIGVADGVGGWSENGVDPALFSQALMFHATQHAEKYVACPERLDAQDESTIPTGDASTGTPPTSPSSSTTSSNTINSTPPSSPGSTASSQHAGSPLSILSYAYAQTLAEAAVPAGSSTATILTFDASKGILRSANVGDSGFLVLRQGVGGSAKSNGAPVGEGAPGLRAGEGVLYASAPLQHGFNTPYQLAKLPPSMRQEGSIDSGPEDAQLWKAQLRGGDIVIVGTDGYFDNVSQSETTQLVKFVGEKHHQAWSAQTAPGQDVSGKDPLAEERSLVQTLAHNLAQYAIMCMGSQTKTSPFEREAARHGIRYPGGKVDDVAVVAALVMEQ